jgi:hypothetical protein
MADFTAATVLVEGLAVVAATNPPRVWSALPLDGPRAGGRGGAVTAIAAVVVLAVLRHRCSICST